MAENFVAQKFNLSDINGGQKYKNGQVLSAETINKVVEAAAYGQEARETAEDALDYSEEALSNSATALSNSATALEKAGMAETNASVAKKTADGIKEDVYSKTEVNDLIAASHMVNITQMASVYPNEAAIQKVSPSEGNGARYLVWVEEGGINKLFYYSYDEYATEGNKWEKGYQIKGSTLYLNLQDGCMYRYTNSPDTTPYPHFIKMTISPATIEEAIGKKANSSDLATVATTGNYADLKNAPTFEEWTFTLENGTPVTKVVYAMTKPQS